MTLLKKMATIIKFNHNSCSSIIFILIQAELFSEEGISTNELMEVSDISRTTLDHAIKELNSYGLVKKKKDGKRNLFGIYLDRLEELCKDE